MKYRKKPVMVEAFRWTGNYDQTEDPYWIIDAILSGVATFDHGLMRIHTLSEGVITTPVGYWIIRDSSGELSICKPDIFEATYELLDDEGHPSIFTGSAIFAGVSSPIYSN